MMLSKLVTACVVLVACLVPSQEKCFAGKYVFLAGEADEFQLPSEPAFPDAELLSFLRGYCCSIIDFDPIPTDGNFGHTFDDLPDGITAATLEFRLKAGTSLVSTDGIGLEELAGEPAAWFKRIEDLPEAGGAWSPGEVATFHLDLADLPPDSGGATSVIGPMNEDHSLDFRLADDTGIDYLLLTVWAGPPCPADLNSDGTVGSDDLLLLLVLWGPCPGAP
jgi:hypothetical protein